MVFSHLFYEISVLEQEPLPLSQPGPPILVSKHGVIVPRTTCRNFKRFGYLRQMQRIPTGVVLAWFFFPISNYFMEKTNIENTHC